MKKPIKYQTKITNNKLDEFFTTEVDDDDDASKDRSGTMGDMDSDG